MADLRIDLAAEFVGKKAFKEADKATGTLGQSVKKLARYMGPAVLGAAFVKFGKDSVNAFVEDQKQAAKLANVVKNLGLELSNPAIASYIDKLTLASGVSDSKLRPAFQSLLSTTGDLTKSQKLLSQAIDISAGSGVDLETVAQDLSNAYVGKTKALAKYNLGLTQAELKTAKFADIQKKLNDLYKGANAAYLNTYAGKMEALKNAAGEASEKIGGALIDALLSLTGSLNIQDLIDQIDSLAEKTVDWIDQFTEGILEIKALAKNFNLGNIFSLTPDTKKLDQGIQQAQVDRYNKMLRRNYMKAWEGVVTPDQAAEQKRAAAAAAKRAADLAKATAKNTAELKKQNALKLASKVFDLQQIQLVAALKGKLSDEERIRVEAMSAILNDNEVLAAQLTKQILMAQDSTGNLYKYFISIGDTKIKNPFEFLDTWLAEFQKKFDATLNKTATYTPATISPAIAALGVTAGYGAGMPMTIANQADNTVFPTYGLQTTGSEAPVINNYFGGSVVTDQKLIDLVMSGTQLSSLSGSPSQIGRIAGMFG